MLGTLPRPISPAMLDVTAPSFPDATENVDNFRLRRSAEEPTGVVNCVLSDVRGETCCDSRTANVDTLDWVGVLINPRRNPEVDGAPVVLGGRNVLRDCGARGDVGETGGDELSAAVPSHTEGCTEMSLVGDVKNLSSGGFVLVICALATDVVVSGGAVVLRAGVKLDVRIRDGGPRCRLVCTEGGRDDGAVL